MTPNYIWKRRFVHLGFNIRNVELMTLSDIQNLIEGYLNGVADDWYRYAEHNYVLWTNKHLDELTKEITEQPGLQKLYVLATEFNPEAATCNGMMLPQFWDWLNKSRT